MGKKDKKAKKAAKKAGKKNESVRSCHPSPQYISTHTMPYTGIMAFHLDLSSTASI